MKKLILTLSLFVGMSFVASAQSAAAGSTSADQPKPVIATQQPDQGTVSKATSEAKVEASTEKKCAGQTKACCKSKTETTTASSCKSKSESGAACCKKKADAKKD